MLVCVTNGVYVDHSKALLAGEPGLCLPVQGLTVYDSDANGRRRPAFPYPQHWGAWTQRGALHLLCRRDRLWPSSPAPGQDSLQVSSVLTGRSLNGPRCVSLHRDMKPDNILLDDDGICILDVHVFNVVSLCYELFTQAMCESVIWGWPCTSPMASLCGAELALSATWPPKSSVTVATLSSQTGGVWAVWSMR